MALGLRISTISDLAPFLVSPLAGFGQADRRIFAEAGPAPRAAVAGTITERPGSFAALEYPEDEPAAGLPTNSFNELVPVLKSVLSPAMAGGSSHPMSPHTRYWTLHWFRVALWPLPVLTLFRVARGALNLVRRRKAA